MTRNMWKNILLGISITSVWLFAYSITPLEGWRLLGAIFGVGVGFACYSEWYHMTWRGGVK